MELSKQDITNPDLWKRIIISENKKSTNKKCLTAGCWDRAAEGYDDLDACRDYSAQVESVINTLKSYGILDNESSVIDVACGTGTYAVGMAKYCRSVTCLDISQRMLEKLEEKRKRSKLSNIEIINADWHKFETDKSYDLVFCSMSPLLRDPANIDAFLNLSNRYAAFVTWAGIRENTVLSYLGKKILGRVPGRDTSDMNLIFNYIYSLGYAPDLKFFRGCWEKKRETDKQISHIIWRLEMYRPLEEHEKEIVSNYVRERSENGFMTTATRVRTVLMIIDRQADIFDCD